MLRTLSVFALCLGLAACSLPPRVEKADPVAPRPLAISHASWPRALAPPVPEIHVEGPQAPRDMGRHGKCEVLLIDESELGTVLFHLGRLQDASPKIGATATFAHPAPDRTKVTVTVTNGSFAVMSLVYPARTERVKGHVIYVGTMAMLSRPEQEFIERLRDLGWHVAALVPFSVMSEFQQLAMDPALRHAPAEEAAPRVAGLIDHHLASQAYAAESLVRYLEKHESGFLVGQRVLIGGSMGSLVIPALAERVGEVDSIVLLAGGGNVSRVIHESKLKIFDPGKDLIVEETSDALVLADREEGELGNMKAEIYEKTALDPIRFAPALSQTRILMLTANRDRIVPRANADLLHEALGRPERWHYPFGHVALFVRLPQQAERIEHWMMGGIL